MVLGVLGAACAFVMSWTGGCGASVPLKLTNESPVEVAARLVEFRVGESGEQDWAELMSEAEVIQPGASTTWSRRAGGASYLLAVKGPGLEGKLGYSVFALPDAPLDLLVRGDKARVGLWLGGERPVMMRP